VRNIAQGEQRTSVRDAGVIDMTATSFRPLHVIRTRFVLDCVTRAVVVNKVITMHTTDTPILHAEKKFISAERGPRQGILSQTSLKCTNHFRSFLNLTIFICKQLKRPVAFGAVQASCWFCFSSFSDVWWFSNNIEVSCRHESFIQ